MEDANHLEVESFYFYLYYCELQKVLDDDRQAYGWKQDGRRSADQRKTTKVRQREPVRRAGNVQATDRTSLCQIWIDFEDGTRDLHTSFTILDLVKNVSPKLDNLAVHRVDYNQPT